MANRLIVLMVDGVSAEHYRSDAGRFPHFQALEKRGFRVENLHAEVLGTSLPGRTSMMTGVTADMSGVYGNKIWDPEMKHFRYANPNDVRVPTLHSRARAAGLVVANMGFGMIRPEDADIFRAPWWAMGFIHRARDAAPQPADEAWLRVATHQTDERFARACAEAGVPDSLPMLDLTSDAQRAFYGFIADQAMVDWAGVLAVSSHPPDLIVVESLLTDTIQHETGYKSPLAQWSVMQADMALGKLMTRLRLAGVEDQWHIAVMSDHGHSPVEKALHPQVILPGVPTQAEGQSLLVAPRDSEELASVQARLAVYGVEPYPNTCIPPELREQVFLFMAPDGTSFEDNNPEETEPAGPARITSSHGLRPGLPGDDRFALFAGPVVPQGRVAKASAIQVMPTLASILGISLEAGFAPPVFQTQPVT